MQVKEIEKLQCGDESMQQRRQQVDMITAQGERQVLTIRYHKQQQQQQQSLWQQ
jgi:hypothetical protein